MHGNHSAPNFYREENATLSFLRVQKDVRSIMAALDSLLVALL
jgi:hypothetical protein